MLSALGFRCDALLSAFLIDFFYPGEVGRTSDDQIGIFGSFRGPDDRSECRGPTVGGSEFGIQKKV